MFASTHALARFLRPQAAIARGIRLLMAILMVLGMVSQALVAQAAGAPIDLKVNFQDAATTPPTGYLRDSGEAYGARTGADQGSGLTYGWVQQADFSQPLSLVANGRNRTTANQRLCSRRRGD